VSVDVSPKSTALLTGATQQLSATPLDAAGNALAGRAITWTSSNTSVASVSGAGLVTAVGAGSATITAATEGASGTASLSVSAPPPAPVARVDIDPATATMVEGARRQFTAITRDAAGNRLTGRSCSWSTNSSQHASVNGSGEVTALKSTKKGPPLPNDTLLITATCEGRSGSATLLIN
jgi:uncharacterized protein YjdB